LSVSESDVLDGHDVSSNLEIVSREEALAE